MKTIQRFREALDWLVLKPRSVRRAADGLEQHRILHELVDQHLDG